MGGGGVKPKTVTENTDKQRKTNTYKYKGVVPKSGFFCFTCDYVYLYMKSGHSKGRNPQFFKNRFFR